MYRTYSVKEFIKNLSEGAFKRPILQRGIVKLNTSASSETLFFSSGERGDAWIEIPIEQIEEIAFITMLLYDDHEYPFVEISFRTPSVENRQATMFNSLFQNSQLGVRPISNCEEGCLKIKDTQSRLNCMLKCIAQGK